MNITGPQLSQNVKGIALSFYQKFEFFFRDCNLAGIKLNISVATLWKNEQKPSNIQNLDSTHFAPFWNLISYTWSFYKMFGIVWYLKHDLSVLFLLELYIINGFRAIVPEENCLRIIAPWMIVPWMITPREIAPSP